MCRLLGYLGSPILLDYLLYKPEHSLVVQSYEPREMTSGVVNADGFGVGWYHPQKETDPFTYKNILPIWNDINLPNLGRYVESGCVLSGIRSATSGQTVELSNCQPYQSERLLFVHNGFIDKFSQLQRPLRDLLSDTTYQAIKGTSDSEHIFALLLETLQANPEASLEFALKKVLLTLKELATKHEVSVSANIIITDGHQLVASRYAHATQPPSLYWLRDDPTFPQAVVIASEPLFNSNWVTVPEQSIVSVKENCDIQVNQI